MLRSSKMQTLAEALNKVVDDIFPSKFQASNLILSEKNNNEQMMDFRDEIPFFSKSPTEIKIASKSLAGIVGLAPAFSSLQTKLRSFASIANIKAFFPSFAEMFTSIFS
jgi:hypothetical protein